MVQSSKGKKRTRITSILCTLSLSSQILLSDSQGDLIVSFSLPHLELEETGNQVLELSLSEVVVGVVVDFAQINQLEICDKILPKDKEHSVCVCLPACIDIIECLFLRRSETSPKGLIIVTCSAFPFLVAPGISQLYHPLRVVIHSQLNKTINTIIKSLNTAILII